MIKNNPFAFFLEYPDFFNNITFDIKKRKFIIELDSFSHFDKAILFFSNLFYKLGYLFNFVDYEIKIIDNNFIYEKELLKRIVLFIINSPFFWSNKDHFLFLIEKINVFLNFDFRNYIIYLYDKDEVLKEWRNKLVSLKEILKKMGLAKIKFSLKKKKIEYINYFPNKIAEKKKINNIFSNTLKLSNNIPHNYKKNYNLSKDIINIEELIIKWKDRKISDVSIHTKFSTLDGVNSVSEYIDDAKSKKYSLIGITDHYNIQSFPDISEFKKKETEVKIAHGCELDMLDDEFPFYMFKEENDDVKKSYDVNGINAPIYGSKYCIFDLETTGFFSGHGYDEIIEIGYIIYELDNNGFKIIKEAEHFIKPRIINKDSFPHWFKEEHINKIKNGKKIEEILPILKDDWKNCILVAHNSKKFDFGFIRREWKDFFGYNISNLVIDTLPLSWIFFPKKKSYRLENLVKGIKKEKITQTHHSLDDSKLLFSLFSKIIKIIEENKFFFWNEIENKIDKSYYFNHGNKVIVLVKNQEGLKNLYQLITISHTERLFRNPCVFRSDLEKYRSGLIFVSSGSSEGEIFSVFSSYESQKYRKKIINFYDFIGLGVPSSFSHIFKKIKKEELENLLFCIIKECKEMNKPFISLNNVHYCNPEDKIIKKILVSNDGINGRKHSLYNEIIDDNKKKLIFDCIPNQHLLNINELLKEWSFLSNISLIEEVIFYNFGIIKNSIEDIDIFPNHDSILEIEKSLEKDEKDKENELLSFFNNKAKEIFGEIIPRFIASRIDDEWKIIKEKKFISIFWLAFKVVKKTISDGYIVGSRGTIGASFIAFLCGITEINPLPIYKYCNNCFYLEKINEEEKKEKRIESCYDYIDFSIFCPSCKEKKISIEGNDLSFESFFGLKGEKTPDIDLNFSGKYQKKIHDYVRELLGKNYVFRIGTISALSEQTAKIFYNEYLKISSY